MGKAQILIILNGGMDKTPQSHYLLFLVFIYTNYTRTPPHLRACIRNFVLVSLNREGEECISVLKYVKYSIEPT